MKLTIVSTSVCVNLRTPVSLQNATHCPLAIDKATITHFNVFLVSTDWASQVAISPIALQTEHAVRVAPINDDQLLISRTPLIVTVGEPAKAVGNLSKPGSLILPVDLFHILDRVESEVDAERDLRDLCCLALKVVTRIRLN